MPRPGHARRYDRSRHPRLHVPTPAVHGADWLVRDVGRRLAAELEATIARRTRPAARGPSSRVQRQSRARSAMDSDTRRRAPRPATRGSKAGRKTWPQCVPDAIGAGRERAAPVEVDAQERAESRETRATREPERRRHFAGQPRRAPQIGARRPFGRGQEGRGVAEGDVARARERRPTPCSRARRAEGAEVEPVVPLLPEGERTLEIGDVARGREKDVDPERQQAAAASEMAAPRPRDRGQEALVPEAASDELVHDEVDALGQYEVVERGTDELDAPVQPVAPRRLPRVVEDRGAVDGVDLPRSRARGHQGEDPRAAAEVQHDVPRPHAGRDRLPVGAHADAVADERLVRPGPGERIVVARARHGRGLAAAGRLEQHDVGVEDGIHRAAPLPSPCPAGWPGPPAPPTRRGRATAAPSRPGSLPRGAAPPGRARSGARAPLRR